jgi:acyl carrier protein
MSVLEPEMQASFALEPQMLAVFATVWSNEMGPGDPVPDLRPETVLLDTGLDSMGFAIFVSELEDVLGYDPFAIAENITAYPQTFAEFVSFYETHRPA